MAEYAIASMTETYPLRISSADYAIEMLCTNFVPTFTHLAASAESMSFIGGTRRDSHSHFPRECCQPTMGLSRIWTAVYCLGHLSCIVIVKGSCCRMEMRWLPSRKVNQLFLTGGSRFFQAQYSGVQSRKCDRRQSFIGSKWHSFLIVRSET
jgi:hypothetical protein